MAQEFQERQEWQTEDGGVFTVHPGEQVRAGALQAVGANAAQNVIALKCQVGIEEWVRERAHDQPRLGDVLPETFPAAPADDGRRQDVRPAAQRLQLRSGGREIGRLVEPGSVADQDLVGTDDHSVRLDGGDPGCLCIGEAQRSGCRIRSL